MLLVDLELSCCCLNLEVVFVAYVVVGVHGGGRREVHWAIWSVVGFVVELVAQFAAQKILKSVVVVVKRRDVGGRNKLLVGRRVM